jgi:hypothetical protein
MGSRKRKLDKLLDGVSDEEIQAALSKDSAVRLRLRQCSCPGVTNSLLGCVERRRKQQEGDVQGRELKAPEGESAPAASDDEEDDEDGKVEPVAGTEDAKYSKLKKGSRQKFELRAHIESCMSTILKPADSCELRAQNLFAPCFPVAVYKTSLRFLRQFAAGPSRSWWLPYVFQVTLLALHGWVSHKFCRCLCQSETEAELQEQSPRDQAQAAQEGDSNKAADSGRSGCADRAAASAGRGRGQLAGAADVADTVCNRHAINSGAESQPAAPPAVPAVEQQDVARAAAAAAGESKGEKKASEVKQAPAERKRPKGAGAGRQVLPLHWLRLTLCSGHGPQR